MTKVLFMLDVQNTYYSALGFIGAKAGTARVKHEKLQSHVIKELGLDPKDITLTSYAYVVQSTRYANGPRFFKVLENLGFILKVKVYDPVEQWQDGSIIGSMQFDMLAKAAKYDVVVVGSGNGTLIPAFQQIRNNHSGVKLVIAAFPRTIHGQYTEENIVDDIIYFTEDVILRIGDGNDNKKDTPRKNQGTQPKA